MSLAFESLTPLRLFTALLYFWGPTVPLPCPLFALYHTHVFAQSAIAVEANCPASVVAFVCAIIAIVACMFIFLVDSCVLART